MNVTLLTYVISFIVIAVPYVSAMLQHIKSKKLKRIQVAALRITKALEESGMGGVAKKKLAETKLDEVVASIPMLKLTPDEISDYIDEAVVSLREAGIKTPLITKKEINDAYPKVGLETED